MNDTFTMPEIGDPVHFVDSQGQHHVGTVNYLCGGETIDFAENGNVLAYAVPHDENGAPGTWHAATND